MTDKNYDIDDHTATLLTKLFQDFALAIQARYEERVSNLEKMLEAIDKQMATIIVGYGEQASFIEALVSQLAFATDDQRKSFHETLSETRKKMLEVMQSAAEGFVADENPDLAAAITELVKDQSFNSDN